MRPMYDATLCIPLVLSGEFDRRSRAQIVDTWSQIEVVGYEERLTRRQPDDEALVPGSLNIVSQHPGNDATAANLHAAQMIAVRHRQKCLVTGRRTRTSLRFDLCGSARAMESPLLQGQRRDDAQKTDEREQLSHWEFKFNRERIASRPCENPGMEVLREAGYRAVPWKNGGGITREILRAPAEPTAFDWRLSLATIDAPGPFSSFDGYDRTLLLVRGAGIELDFGGHGRARLDGLGQQASFDGAWDTSCTLVDGPSTDLNLIVSRGRAESLCRSLSLEAPETTPTGGWSETIVCCISGRLRVTNMSGDTADLNAVDVARCAPGDGAITCTPLGPPAKVFIAQVRLQTA